MKGKYSEEEIAEFNILDILENERQRGKPIIGQSELCFLIDFQGKSFNKISITNNLTKNSLVDVDRGYYFQINRKGRNSLRKFKSRSDSKSRSIFNSNRPRIYYNMVRIDRLEELFGFLFLSLLLLVLIYTLSTHISPDRRDQLL